MRVLFLFVARWVPYWEVESMVMMVVVAVIMCWWVSYGFQVHINFFHLANVASEVCSCNICSRLEFSQYLKGEQTVSAVCISTRDGLVILFYSTDKSGTSFKGFLEQIKLGVLVFFAHVPTPSDFLAKLDCVVEVDLDLID